MRRRDVLLAAGASALRSRAAASGLGTIAYLQGDGLWVRSLPDGAPRKIAAGGKNPRFSASGEWIAFDGGVVRSDGSTGARLPPGANKWLPQQERLAVASAGGFSLFSPRNGWSTPVATYKGVELPVFNSDGSKIAFSRAVRTGTGAGGEALADGQVCVAALGGARPRTLFSQYLVLPIPYAWTRDSRYLLYWQDPDFSASARADGLLLFRVPAAGGRSQPLGVGTLIHEDLLALSPTASKLAVTTGSGREIYGRNRIAIVDLETLGLRYLTGGHLSAMAPSWSPDGRRIAYVQAPVPPLPADNLTAAPYIGRRRIWVADASGAAPPVPITADNRYRDEEPVWAADGAHILFCRLDAKATATLWFMGAGGESPIQVSDALALTKNAFGTLGFYSYIDWRASFDWRRP